MSIPTKELLLSAVVLTAASVLASPTSAAEVTADSLGRASIVGVIEAPDVAKVEALYRTEHPPKIIWINSQGGDVEAAMAIGRLIRRAKGFVAVDTACASACVFILAGAVSRAVEGSVVIHRPFLTAGLSGAAAYDDNYKRVAQMVRSYLDEMNVPSELGERMVAVPPDEGEVLTAADLHRYMLDSTDPAHEQELAANEAERWGITLLEQRRRQALQKAVCNWEESRDAGLFELAHRSYCQRAIMGGEAPEIVQVRSERVLQSRAEITALQETAQESCIKEIMLGSVEKDCLSNNPFADLIPKQHH